MQQYLQFIIFMFIYSSTCSGRPHAPTALLLPRSEGETIGCYCSCWAAEEGREDFRNML